MRLPVTALDAARALFLAAASRPHPCPHELTPTLTQVVRSVQSQRLSMTLNVIDMTQITARIPDELVAELDRAAARLHRSRAEVIRQAIERYLEDFQDLTLAVERLQDPNDPVLDWQQVRDELVGSD
jgi:transposase